MVRWLVACRALLGSVLLVQPDAILDQLSRRCVGVGERRVARLLGLRHLAEGALVARHPSRGWLLAGAAVDAIHAVSMAVLAVASPRHRRVATASALTAAATAAGGLTVARLAHRFVRGKVE